VLPRLLQIRAVAGTIERYLSLLAAALGADAAVHSRAEALLLANFANGTTQIEVLLYGISIMASDAGNVGKQLAISSWQEALSAE